MVELNLNVNDNSKEIIDNIVKPAYAVSQTVLDIWELCFGGISTYANKIQYKREQSLNDYKNETLEKISKIPPENLCEPQLSIIGPAFDASKYYFEEKELRELFSNLVANSMNKEYIDKTHPAFVDIIKHLSPFDAKLITDSFKLNVKTRPICRIRMQTDNQPLFGVPEKIFNHFYSESTGSISFENYFLTQKLDANQTFVSRSLSNLSRLGIIEITFYEWLADFAIYKPFEESDFFKNQLSEHNKFIEQVSSRLKNSANKNNFRYINLARGMVKVTPLGKDFISVCCQ